MKEERISIIAKTMLSMAEEYGSIDEEWYRSMFDSVAEIVGGFTSKLNALDAIHEPSLTDFIAEFESSYAYGENNGQNDFTIGACWAISGILNAAANRIQDRNRQDGNRSIAQSHIDLFLKIKEAPGITQSELAGQLSKSKSNLSQILSRLENSGLLLSLQQGRFRHYYLSTDGAKALDAANLSHIKYQVDSAMSNKNNNSIGFPERKTSMKEIPARTQTLSIHNRSTTGSEKILNWQFDAHEQYKAFTTFIVGETNGQQYRENYKWSNPDANESLLAYSNCASR